MKIELEFAELHTALFLAGTNLQLKLEPAKRQDKGMKLFYDRTEKELLVYFNKKVAIIPSSNVASMTPVDVGCVDEVVVPHVAAPVAKHVVGKIKAQASTPTSHVFKDDPSAER